MELEVSIVKRENGVIVLLPVGSINGTTCPELESQIESVLGENITTLVLDMSGIGFMSSVGVGLVNTTKNKLKKQGGEFAMINLQPQIKKVFEIMSLLPTLNVFESVEELDVYLGKIQKRVTEEGTSLSSD
jgi:stage II sporulation protein AA (anti-sigma F factor antagonist)